MGEVCAKGGGGEYQIAGEVNNYKWPYELTTLPEWLKYWLYDDIE